MKNRLHRYDINRIRPRHGHKHTNIKMRLGMMMIMCNKQHKQHPKLNSCKN